MTRDEFDDALNALLTAASDEAFERGRKAGYKETQRECDKVIQGERDRLLEQGRLNAMAEITFLTDKAREEGRVLGVEEGSALASSKVSDKIVKEAADLARREGDAAGYKRGRGDGYKNGWNDAISTPARAHIPKE